MWIQEPWKTPMALICFTLGSFMASGSQLQYYEMLRTT
jgi:hypothetical protein